MASKLGSLFGGGEEGGGIGSKIGGLFDGIKSIASQGLQAAAGVVQGMSGGVSKETVVQMAEDIKLVMKEGQEELLNTLMEISEASKTASTDSNEKMLKKLDELKDAVLLGALIEMDGEILTRGVRGRSEARDRVNYASRMIS